MKVLLALCLLAAPSLAAANETVSFNQHIRPILSNKCFACHGPSNPDRKGGLRLDQPGGELGALTPRDGEHIIKPGAPEASELWRRITTDDPIDRMPPDDSHKEPLADEELALVKQWILDGAEYQDFWSFIPPKKRPLPAVEHADWAQGMIDRRVLARLEEEGLQPQPEADKRTLLRRVTFDLTGLPPTLEEIDRFLDDDRPDAYKRVVDDLLQRPAFGEHMARYWADLVRLADTNGMHKDFPRDFTVYRDWIIRSFNENMPYDEFITYQLAGDRYDDPTEEQLIASGFNRLHMIIDVGTALPEESLHKNVLDRVEAFGTVFLGLTVQCAQCHDHKYDPITQKEYFQMYAFFNNFSGEPETQRRPPRGLQPPFINLPTPEQEKQLSEIDAEEQRLNNLLAAIQKEPEEAVAKSASSEPESAPGEAGKSGEAERIQAQLEQVEEEKEKFLEGVPGAMVMREAEPPRQAYFLNRGAYDDPGEPVDRNTPAFLPPLPEKEGRYSRMDLAEWLLKPDHPLTARVAVNRFWQQFFGVGLVKTSEDFGAQGQWPSHPAMLDDLAVEFMESGWDVKALVRRIVLSNTYRQRSDAPPEAFRNDPENRLLARGPRYRMDAEMIRDQILAVSGQLNREMFGPSVKPPQPPGLWEMVSMAEPKTYVADTGEKIYRRSLYTYWRRGMPPPQMTLMNAPSREFCVARRERTNTPLQALLLMNEGEYFKAAKACVQSTVRQFESKDESLHRLYEKITSQVPDADRLALMRDTLADFRAIYGKDQALTEALTPELDGTPLEERVDLAAWTMMAHSLLNLELAKVKR